MSDYSLGSRAVYAAQRYSRELVESVWSGWFYDHLLDVLKNDTWREYSTEAFGRPCRFDALRDFLAHEDGLGWPSVDETLAMIEAVRDCPQDLPPEKNAPVGRLQEWAKDALLGLERCGVTRMTGAASHAQPLAAHRRPTTEEQEDKGSVTTFKDRGQSYLLRRLARDAPDILERVKSGEIKSARAAAIEAGIIKPVPSVRLVDDADQIADSIVTKLGRDRAMAVAIALAELLRDAGVKP